MASLNGGKTAGRFVAWGCAMGVGLAAPFGVAVFRPDLELANVLAFSAAGVLSVAALGSRRIGLARAGVFASASCLPLGYYTLAILSHDLSRSRELDAAQVLAGLAAYPFAFGGAWLLALIARRASVHSRRTAARSAALILAAAAALVVPVAAHRHATHPDPRSLRREIEPVGCFFELNGGKGPFRPSDQVSSGPWTLTMQVEPQRGCAVQVVEGGHEVGTFTYRPKPGRIFDIGICGRTCMEYMPERSVWLASYQGDWGESDKQAFAGPPFEARGATYDSFATNLAPPALWIALPLAGLLVAALCFAPRDHCLRERLTWREETRDGIAVLIRPEAGKAGYRRAARPPTVIPGTLADIRALLLARSAGRWMFALAAIALTGAPLFAAAWLGFVF